MKPHTVCTCHRTVRFFSTHLLHRTAQLRSRESKVQRQLTEVKDRENKASYKESMLHRRVQDIEYRERILEGQCQLLVECRT